MLQKWMQAVGIVFQGSDFVGSDSLISFPYTLSREK